MQVHRTGQRNQQAHRPCPVTVCAAELNALSARRRGLLLRDSRATRWPQKVLAARNLQLERLSFRDPILYQYGLLPDQYVPPRCGYTR